MFIGLLVVFAAAVTCWIRAKKNGRANLLMNRLPQGPRPLPIIGNALELIGGHNHTLDTMQVKWPEKYGEIYVTYVGSHRNVNISSPDLAEKVFNNQKILDKGADYDFLLPWLGEGLLLSSGAKWKGRRRLLTPAFHYQILDNFMDAFNKHTRILCRVLDDMCHERSAMMLDIYPFITNCTLDIICEAAMGIEMNAQADVSDYVKSVLRINKITVERVIKPWLANDLLFALSPTGRENRRHLNTLHGFTEKVICSRREELSRNPIEADESDPNQSGLKNRRPLLDVLLTSKDAASLTDRDIRDEIDTFMFEGHDTTAAAISWFLYCMAEHPEHQEKVWKEIQDVFGEDVDRIVTKEDLPHLTYLECCIKESGRLFTTVPTIERFTKEDVLIGDYLIPEGTSILLLLHALHRNPRIFPDPHVYNPERFLPDQSIGRHPYAYVPFSAGPRNCIGQRFALMEVKVTAAKLLHRFKFSVTPLCKKPVPSWQVVMKPLHGVELVLTPRY